MGTPVDLAQGDVEMMKLRIHTVAERGISSAQTITDTLHYTAMNRGAIAGAAGFRLMTESGSGVERRLPDTGKAV